MPEWTTRQRTLSMLAFASIWFVWGSTFLVIRYAIHGIPPFLMCGFRLLSAGLVLLVWARLRGDAWPHVCERCPEVSRIARFRISEKPDRADPGGTEWTDGPSTLGTELHLMHTSPSSRGTGLHVTIM